jgi:hypothetical protein
MQLPHVLVVAVPGRGILAAAFIPLPPSRRLPEILDILLLGIRPQVSTLDEDVDLVRGAFYVHAKNSSHPGQSDMPI